MSKILERVEPIAICFALFVFRFVLFVLKQVPLASGKSAAQQLFQSLIPVFVILTRLRLITSSRRLSPDVQMIEIQRCVEQ